MPLIYLIWIICAISNCIIYLFIPQDFGEHSMFVISLIYFFKYWYLTIPGSITSFIIKIAD